MRIINSKRHGVDDIVLLYYVYLVDKRKNCYIYKQHEVDIVYYIILKRDNTIYIKPFINCYRKELSVNYDCYCLYVVL